MDAGQGSLELDDTDIPGAHFDEPLEAHNVAVLRWHCLQQSAYYTLDGNCGCYRHLALEPLANVASSFCPEESDAWIRLGPSL